MIFWIDVRSNYSLKVHEIKSSSNLNKVADWIFQGDIFQLQMVCSHIVSPWSWEGKRSSFYQPTKPPGLSKMEVFLWWNFCVFFQAQKTSRFLPWKTAGGVLGAARKLPSQSGGVAACWESQVFPGEGWYLEDYRRYRKWLLTPICKPWMAIWEGVPQPYLGGRKLTMGQLTTYPSVMGPDPPSSQ